MSIVRVLFLVLAFVVSTVIGTVCTTEFNKEQNRYIAYNLQHSVFLVGTETAVGTAFSVGGEWFMTAAHVVKDATEVELLINGKELPVVVVAVDEANDMAVLRVKGLDLPGLALCDSAPKLGDKVYQAGFPGGNGPLLSTGVVSGMLKTRNHPHPNLMHTANTLPGSSGSPVVDERGCVVALTWGISVSQGFPRVEAHSIVYTTEVEFLRSFLENAKKGVKVSG
jgi:S1-C subfamily serine protease